MVDKRIAIIAPGSLPIPALQSGGIEQLIENIINQNELTPKAKITVISAYSSLTKHLEKKYKHTHFLNVKYSFFTKCYNYINRNIVSKILQKEYFHHNIFQIMAFLDNNTFDKIVILGNDEQIIPISQIVAKEKLIYYQATLMLDRANDFQLCNKILVGCNHSKQSILSHTKTISENDVQIIQSGIDIDYFINNKLSKKNIVREKYQIENDIPLICYLGRLVASKGVIVLLKAALLLKDSISFKLILIGSYGSNFGAKGKKGLTDEEIEIRKLISELGDKCVVTGFVNVEELQNYLASIDIGIVPSLVEDVSPLTYFQYQAMGIPSIVSDGGGIPEFYSPNYSIMVKRGSNMIEDLAKALIELIQNKEKREIMAEAALENREYLGIKRYFNDFINLVLKD
jgi:glycosyltransferase involved in cell wall biosynthesis